MTSLAVKHVLFDLDGTLIDSAPAILDAFAKAFARCQRQPVVALEPGVIGPPLMDTLALLAGSSDSHLLQTLAAAFKEEYDTEGYKQTYVFPGIVALLEGLRAAGHDLYIATNKRLLPTQRILDFLAWTPYFAGVYALDAFSPPAKSKADMIGQVLRLHQLAIEDSIYIGDRDEDGQSAQANGLRFLLASWGYDGRVGAHWTRVASPAALQEALRVPV